MAGDDGGNECRTRYDGNYIRVVERGGWEYVSRVNARGAVAIIAITTDRKLLLVEQHRPAVDARVIDLPAGLVGDEGSEEPVLDAARRELLEETGYTAERWTERGVGLSSSGLTDESTAFFVAADCTKVDAGGGVAGEAITVHRVAVDAVEDWLAKEQRERHVFVETKVYAGLYWAGRAMG